MPIEKKNKAFIQIKNLTKDYGKNRGIFDINLDIKRGQVYGIVGTNGSGKTTTIRNIMGFVKADKGSVTINGLDAWKDALEIKKFTSYVPGEISFPRLPTGKDFLKIQAEFLQIKDPTYMNYLLDKLKLDPNADLKRMSKGMKQKTALIAALMGEKDLLILDEPTTGLDPLMRDVFISLIREEKSKGKTILISTHIFGELEAVCDKVAMIKNGRIINVVDVNDIDEKTVKIFRLGFENKEELKEFLNQNEDEKSSFLQINKVKEDYCRISFDKKNINQVFELLSKHKVKFFREEEFALEHKFKESFYEDEKNT
ncbi:ABC transporter ATP-binding protein [Peptostreptococcus equinus]|uniref:ATP-binding cassette domain-containing protein n=1 Tax=Peptostreptococcus equinus TaxID=3003601 RepID=A0ABY7JMC8_9FIRM|nr:ATP-binding cassette domain-containing protein [Peptostreptococcus sp. CBA3647]WAW14516.1 ATP-binding cassette domain-containing protein [Peptostreptococcus sp. CBA3647]